MTKEHCVLCNQQLNIGEYIYHSDCTNLYSAIKSGRTEPCANCKTTGRVGVAGCYACNDSGYVKPTQVSKLDSILNRQIIC